MTSKSYQCSKSRPPFLPTRSSKIYDSFTAESTSDGMALYGYHWAADAPVATVSLVHGFGEHCGRYEKLAAHLNANGISVVGVDLRGHGQTESPRGVAKTYSDIHGDLKTLIAETAGLYQGLPHYLFGHSMGGGLVLHHGLSSHSDSLAGYLVSAPLIRLKRYVPWIVRKAVKTIRPFRPNGTFPIPVAGVNISTIPEEQDRYDNDPLNHNRLGFGLAVGMIEAGENVLLNASQWNKPLRLWHSSADRITNFDATKQFAQKARQCEFTAMEEVQHEMHQDVSRERVYAMMTEFILKS